jgi:hypothetical protein
MGGIEKMTKEELEKQTMEWKNNYILKLEKENAELKERIKTLEQIKREHTDYTIKVEEERTCVKEQLTKAKEIIKEFMKYEINEYDGSLEIHFEELKKQAEQFLKDREVEK